MTTDDVQAAGVATTHLAEYRGSDRPEMDQFLPNRPKRVLEVGCGTAQFLRKIKSAELWGIEPFAESAEEAKRHVHKVLIGVFEDVRKDLPENHFDLIVCNDVIEHMVDHDGFIEAIKSYLAPGGVIVGSIPNVRYYKNLVGFLVRRQWEYTECGILDRTHLRFFTGPSLRNFLQRHNYKIEQFKGINGDMWKFWSHGSTWFALALLIGTFGYYRDILPLQFGFRITPKA